MAVKISSSYDPVQKIALAIGGEQKVIALYAPQVTRTQANFERQGGTVSFKVIESGPARIAQYGNQPSSKQRQGSYAIKLPTSGTLRVELGRSAGKYGKGCDLCLQIYDTEHVFLTQIRLPLSQPDQKVETKLPKSAAHACFSVELSGSGVLDDVDVKVSLAGFAIRSHLAIADGLASADDLRSLLEAARGAKPEPALSRLRQTFISQPRLVIASISRWYSERAYSSLVELMRVALPWRGTAEIAPVMAQLLYLSARSLGNLNATVSALDALVELQALPDWREHLSKWEVQNVLLLQGQSLVRNGKLDEGLAAFNEARLNDPKHWEAYFLLANNLDDQNGPLKDAYYQAAQALQTKPNSKLAIAAVENELKNNRWATALSKGLEALVNLKPPSDIWLALANVYLQIGDTASWRRYVAGHFEQFGLTAPQFDLSSAEDSAKFPPASRPPASDSRDRGLVAVIMTTFHSTATLEQAALSVLTQTYQNIQLIIVDDASSDDTTSIAQSIVDNDNRVRLIRNTTNAGTYACKNMALKITDADYYTFHDSDDWMHPQHIERHLDVMEDREAACTTSCWFRMEMNGQSVARHAGGYQHFNPASIFVRKEVVETIGYFDSVRTGADTEYFWRIRNRYPRNEIVEIDQPLAIGLSHDASLTQSGVTAFNKNRFSAVRLAYWESWVRWHIETVSDDSTKLRVPFPLEARPYWAPPAITAEGGHPDVEIDASPEGSLLSQPAARAGMENT